MFRVVTEWTLGRSTPWQVTNPLAQRSILLYIPYVLYCVRFFWVLFIFDVTYVTYVTICDIWVFYVSYHTLLAHVIVWYWLNNFRELFVRQKYFHKTLPSSCIIKAIISAHSSPLLSNVLDWIEGSLWGRWTISRFITDVITHSCVPLTTDARSLQRRKNSACIWRLCIVYVNTQPRRNI